MGGRVKRGNRRFKFQKRGQLFIRVHKEAFSVIAVRIGDEDCLPAMIHGCNTAPTPTGFAEIVSDDFPVLHSAFLARRSSFAHAASSALFRAMAAVVAVLACVARITSCASAASMNLRRVSDCIGCCCSRHAREGASEYDSSEDCNSFHVLGIMRMALSGVQP
jgi:hypothetical protein